MLVDRMAQVRIENIAILQILNIHSSDVTTCDFDSSFRIASGSSDRKLVVCDWRKGDGFVESSYSPFTEYKYSVTKVKFIPTEHELVSASSDGCIYVLNSDDGELLDILMHTNLTSVRTFCFINANRCLWSAGDDGTVCIWNFENKKTLKKSLQVHDETISVICVTNDSRYLLTGDMTGFVKLWSVPAFCDCTDNVEGILQPCHAIPDCHDLGINEAEFSSFDAFSNRGKEYLLITGGNDNLIKVWKIIGNKYDDGALSCTSELLFTIVGHGSAVTAVKFHPSGNIAASTSLDKTVRLWAIDEFHYRCLKILKQHKRYVTTCSFSPDGTLLATGSNDRSVIIWDLTGTKTVESSVGMTWLNKSLCSPLKIKNISIMMQKIENLGNAINACVFVRDNLLAAGGTDKLLRLWHRLENKFVELSISPLQAHQYPVNYVDSSCCGQYLASCSVDGTAIVWNLTEYSQIGTVHSVEGGIKCCKFSPNSEALATGGDDETVWVWSMPDLLLKVNLNGHTDAVSCLSFSKDSRYLASGCQGGSIRLWCVIPCTNICMVCEENVHDLGLNSVDFCLVDHYSPRKNEHLLASCGNDSLVKLWNVSVIDELSASMSLVHSLVGHGGDVTCVRFALKTAAIVASSATDKTARIWDTISGTCLHVLDSRESILTCCAFSANSLLLATGTLDKSIIVWDLREYSNEFNELAVNQLQKHVDFTVEGNVSNKIVRAISQLSVQDLVSMNVAHEFVCPITHQLMVQPVVCADGHTYERTAIESWLSSGKLSSPMTNEPLSSKILTPNIDLRNRIMLFLKEYKRM